MKTTPIALAYCIDNLPYAEAIEKTLSNGSFSISHHYCKKSGKGQSISDQLQDFTGTILLLISDNFLKSLNCMDRALQFIQSKSNQVLPIVVDGRKYDEKSGIYQVHKTKFEKIGDIIPYINYWQNQYLDLRSQRKSIESEQDYDKEAFGEHLRILRQVSSEASEFLRVLRNMPHYPFDEFAEDHFAILFEFLEAEEEWEVFRANNPNLDTQLAELLGQTATPQNEHVEEEELDLGEIPGIELLEGSENIARIIKNKLTDPDESEEEEGQEEPQDEIEELNKKIEALIEEEGEIENDQNEEEENEPEEDEDDQISHLLEDQEGEPASSEEYVEEGHTEDSTPAPEEFTPNEPVLDFSSENSEEEEPLEHPFDDDETPSVDADESKDLDELFEDEQSQWQEEEDKAVVFDFEEEEEEEEEELLSDEQVDALVNQAFDLVNAGQYEDGSTYMEQAIKRYPENDDLKYHYALMLAQNTNDFGPAIAQLDALLEKDAQHENANFLRGELSELDEDYEQALAYYKRVEKQNAEFRDINYRLGVVSMQKQDAEPAKARKYFKKALKKNPEHVDAHYQYALLSNELKDDSKKAIKYLHQTLELEPNHPFAHYDLALLYYQKEKAKKANKHYNEAISINPELQTPENDRAFAALLSTPDLPAPEPVLTESSIKAHEEVRDALSQEEILGLEADALGALKDNIQKLESLLLGKVHTEITPQKPKVTRTIFISGATSGIGKATAIRFAKEGYRLIITGRRIDRLEAFAKALEEEYQVDILPLAFDVSDPEAVKNASAKLFGEWGQIDILVNNAGKAKGFTPIHEGQLGHWNEMIDVNLKGLLYLTREVAPLMVAQESGHIINVCSTAGHEVYPNGNVYCATKYGVDALTKGMRLDLHKFNIRVSQVSPGHVEETEFAEVRFDGDKERAKIYEDFLPLTSTDVANTIYYIASQPAHVNIQDVLMMGTQQASSVFINRSGRGALEEE